MVTTSEQSVPSVFADRKSFAFHNEDLSMHALWEMIRCVGVCESLMRLVFDVVGPLMLPQIKPFFLCLEVYSVMISQKHVLGSNVFLLFQLLKVAQIIFFGGKRNNLKFILQFPAG